MTASTSEEEVSGQISFDKPRPLCARAASGQPGCSERVCLDADGHCLGTRVTDYSSSGQLRVPVSPDVK